MNPADPGARAIRTGSPGAFDGSGRELFFVHINKCGGTSVEQALGLPRGHVTVADYVSELGPERSAAGFSFSFVRNPWDKVVSHYHWRVATNQTGLGSHPIPFREWVLRAYRDREPRYHDKPRMFMPQHHWLEHPDAPGTIGVDFVGRFESLVQDLGALAAQLGLPLDPEIPHLKRTARPPYRACFDRPTRRVVEEWFAVDIDAFGYRF